MIEDLAAGDYNVAVKYNGDNNYNPAEYTVIVTVVKANPELSANVSNNITYGDVAKVTDVNIPSDATGTVTIFINGEEYLNIDVTELEGLKISKLPADEYNITINYNGDNNYNSAEFGQYYLIVNKADPEFVVSVDNEITYGDIAIINLENIAEDASGNVTVIVDDEEYVNIDVNSLNGLIIFDLSAGEHNIVMNYNGDNNYVSSRYNSTINVLKADPEFLANIENITYGEDAFVNIDISSDATGNVTIFVNGAEYTNVDVGDLENLRISGLLAGDYNIVVKYNGDSNYNPIEAEFNIFVSKANPDLVANTEDILFGQDLVIIAALPRDATGNVTFTIYGKPSQEDFPHIINVENGVAVAIFKGLFADNYNITVEYSGDSNYLSDNFTTSAIVEPIETILIGENVKMTYGANKSYIVQLCDYQDIPLAYKTIVININGVNYTRVTNDDGIASLKINLIPGEYVVTAIFEGTNDYLPSEVTNNVSIYSSIIGKDVVKIFRNGTQYYAKFLDGDANPLINESVKFNINGVFYNRQTNDKGVAKLNINLDPREYILTAYNPVTGQQYSNKINVLPTIIANDVTKYFRNGTEYYAKLVNQDGTPSIGADLTFNINGVFYTRTTNDEGIARLKINLDPGEYIITAIDPYTGLKIANKIVVLPKLIGKDIIMNVRDGTQYLVKAVDNVGNPLVGATINMNINGIIYYKATDDDGIAKLTINLDPNSYIITCHYDDCVASNTITVKP